MNEVYFAKLSRTFRTGSVVLFYGDAGSIESTTFDADSHRVVGAGVVLRFVDPAKPALVYRTAAGADSETTGIEFFQDVLYATDAGVRAESFALWNATEVVPDRERWIDYLEQITGRSLSGDTALFDAYSDGMMGTRYREASYSGASLSDWVRHHASLLGYSIDNLSPAGGHLVWEGHDVYTFT